MRDITREGIVGLVQGIDKLQVLVIDEMKDQAQSERERVFRCVAQLEYMRNELETFLEKPFMDMQAQCPEGVQMATMTTSGKIIRNGQGW